MEPTTKHFFMGFAAGVTTAVVLPVLSPVLAETGRPIAKAVLKRSLLTLERLRSTALRAAESIEDLVAEVRAEVDAELTARAGARADSADPAPTPGIRNDVAAAGARWYAAAASGLKSRMAS